jgi:hypothetical protein
LQRLATGSVLHVPTPFVALAVASVVGLDVPGDDREHAITT